MKSNGNLGVVSFVLVGVSLALGGCATNRTRTLAVMAGTGLVVGTIGALAAPQNESKVAHGMLWGGVGAAAAGAIGLFVFDEDARSKQMEQRALRAEAEVKQFRAESDPKLIAEGDLRGAKALPLNLRGLIKDSQWKLYQHDRWVQQDDGRLIHQTEELQFLPGALLPGQKPEASGVTKIE